ncbi:MAG: ABC transporter substrate-binding protein [Candidatus Thorarchaeota archaeon]|jgi:NitT/TauT family transport system substrate-binding protein
MNRNKTVALVVTVVLVSSAVVVALWYPTTVPDVRIGYLSQDLHQLALQVAVEMGWFEEANLTVQLLQYQNGALEMNGFQAGQIDMGYLGAAPALTKSINQGIGVTVLAGANSEGSSIEVLKSEYDSGRVTGIEDLDGKTIFHPGPSTVQNFLLRLALNQTGMSTENVTLEQARVQDMADLLTTDKPAYIAWEPFPSLSMYENITVPLKLSGDIWPQHPCCVLAAENSFMAANPETVQTVVDIHVRASEWILANPLEALDIAIDWLGLDETPVATAFNRITYNHTLNVAGVEAYLRFLISEELVTMNDSEVDSYLDSFIDLSFLT